MDSLSIHRIEMVLVDLIHLMIIIVVGLFCLILLTWGGSTGEFLVPWLTPSVGALVSRLDALVHRKGRWLREQGHDAWEEWKQHHRSYANVIARADVLMGGPIILTSLFYAEYRVLGYSAWSGTQQAIYLALTAGANAASVVNFVSMSLKIKRDYDSAEQHQ